MKLSFSERIHERIAALFPLPEAVTQPEGCALEVEQPTPFGAYRFLRPAPDAPWTLAHDTGPLSVGDTPEALAQGFHGDLACRLAALMATHAAIAELSGTISGREPGGKKWSLDVTGDSLLRMIALGLREPEL